jgi:hypothetical protein
MIACDGKSRATAMAQSLFVHRPIIDRSASLKISSSDETFQEQ